MTRFWFIGCLFYAVVTNAQIIHPRASPYATIVQHIGLSKIAVEYSRPAVRGRKIMGGVVPYGRIWRVGANEATKISVDTPFKVMGNILPKGTYALYAFPGPDSWEMVFHANTGHWGDGRGAYDPSEDVFRITIYPEKTPSLQENFLISFDRIDHNSLEMILKWEYTQIRIPFSVDTHSLMMAEIAAKLKSNATAQTYYEAARYLQEQGLEPALALEHINRAIDLGGDTYYFHRVKSLIQAALEDFKAAVSSAKKSLDLANDQGKDEFVRMNALNILQWEKEIAKEDP